MTNYNEILESAMNWGKTHYPNAQQTQHCAFANSVTYLVTGGSGGYGGPSLREHAVSWSLTGDGIVKTSGVLPIHYPDTRIQPAGKWEFEKACQYAAAMCFGILPKICKKISENEYYFDDSPEDLEELSKM